MHGQTHIKLTVSCHTSGLYLTRWHRYYNPDAVPKHTWMMLIA